MSMAKFQSNRNQAKERLNRFAWLGRAVIAKTQPLRSVAAAPDFNSWPQADIPVAQARVRHGHDASAGAAFFLDDPNKLLPTPQVFEGFFWRPHLNNWFKTVFYGYDGYTNNSADIAIATPVGWLPTAAARPIAQPRTPPDQFRDLTQAVFIATGLLATMPAFIGNFERQRLPTARRIPGLTVSIVNPEIEDRDRMLAWHPRTLPGPVRHARPLQERTVLADPFPALDLSWTPELVTWCPLWATRSRQARPQTFTEPPPTFMVSNPPLEHINAHLVFQVNPTVPMLGTARARATPTMLDRFVPVGEGSELSWGPQISLPRFWPHDGRPNPAGELPPPSFAVDSIAWRAWDHPAALRPRRGPAPPGDVASAPLMTALDPFLAFHVGQQAARFPAALPATHLHETPVGAFELFLPGAPLPWFSAFDVPWQAPRRLPARAGQAPSDPTATALSSTVPGIPLDWRSSFDVPPHGPRFPPFRPPSLITVQQVYPETEDIERLTGWQVFPQLPMRQKLLQATPETVQGLLLSGFDVGTGWGVWPVQIGHPLPRRRPLIADLIIRGNVLPDFQAFELTPVSQSGPPRPPERRLNVPVPFVRPEAADFNQWAAWLAGWTATAWRRERPQDASGPMAPTFQASYPPLEVINALTVWLVPPQVPARRPGRAASLPTPDRTFPVGEGDGSIYAWLGQDQSSRRLPLSRPGPEGQPGPVAFLVDVAPWQAWAGRTDEMSTPRNRGPIVAQTALDPQPVIDLVVMAGAWNPPAPLPVRYRRPADAPARPENVQPWTLTADVTMAWAQQAGLPGRSRPQAAGPGEVLQESLLTPDVLQVFAVPAQLPGRGRRRRESPEPETPWTGSQADPRHGWDVSAVVPVRPARARHEPGAPETNWFQAGLTPDVLQVFAVQPQRPSRQARVPSQPGGQPGVLGTFSFTVRGPFFVVAGQISWAGAVAGDIKVQ